MYKNDKNYWVVLQILDEAVQCGHSTQYSKYHGVMCMGEAVHSIHKQQIWRKVWYAWLQLGAATAAAYSMIRGGACTEQYWGNWGY